MSEQQEPAKTVRSVEVSITTDVGGTGKLYASFSTGDERGYYEVKASYQLADVEPETVAQALHTIRNIANLQAHNRTELYRISHGSTDSDIPF